MTTAEPRKILLIPADDLRAWNDYDLTCAADSIDKWLHDNPDRKVGNHYRTELQRRERESRSEFKDPADGLAERDAKIIEAVLAGEACADVADRHGLSAGSVRRITQVARKAAGTRPASPPLRVVKEHERATPEQVENVLGPWTEALPDDRIAANDGDPIPRPEPPDLVGLFYSARLNVIAGAPATGKSYLALKVAHDAHAGGGRVLWLDAEDSAVAFTARCLQLGCAELTTSDDVRRVDHGDWQAAEPEHIALCWQWLADGFGPGFVVVDSGTATGSGDSLDAWLAWTARHLPPPGVGVLLIEHVVKRPDERYQQAAGSRGKLAKVRGAHIQLDETDGGGWAPGTDTRPPTAGGWLVTLTKDLPGGHGHPRGSQIGVLHGEPHDDGALTVRFIPGGRTASRAEAVARYVIEHPGQTTTEVSEALPGKPRDNSKAIQQAEAEGLIVRIQTEGSTAKRCHPPNYPD